VAEDQIPHVYLIGGEPSLVPVERINRYVNLLSPTSSVTIVTNGLIVMRGVSPKIACFGVPLHGDNPQTHEMHTGIPGGFHRTLETIRSYVEAGHDVRCIPVLTGYNFDQIYGIIKIAVSLGMESIYVDRYEDGGLGAKNASHPKLKPSLEEFRVAVGQMLQARRDFPELGGRVGFGTAIPYCLDERLIREGLTSNCGVGVSFGAINPRGEFRICNQSQLIFGNVLEETLAEIWNSRSLDVYRDLAWVTEPCRDCPLLLECTCGCKVDVNCSNQFCVDYAVRGMRKPPIRLPRRRTSAKLAERYPTVYRRLRPNRYMKLLTKYPNKYLVTRYQTVKLDPTALRVAQCILGQSEFNEVDLVRQFADEIEAVEIRLFVSRLLQVHALDEVVR
jgi:radical SAM protein with 4Fe4S-binding SPASM domain